MEEKFGEVEKGKRRSSSRDNYGLKAADNAIVANRAKGQHNKCCSSLTIRNTAERFPARRRDPSKKNSYLTKKRAKNSSGLETPSWERT